MIMLFLNLDSKNLIQHTMVKYKRNKMCHSIFNQKYLKQDKSSKQDSVYIVIQCEKEKSDSTNFSYNHLYTLTLFNNFISQGIEKIKLNYYRKQILQTTINMLDAFKEVAQDKNIAWVSIAVENNLPQIFRAKKAALFFKDHSEPNLMYSIGYIFLFSNVSSLNLYYILTVSIIFFNN